MSPIPALRTATRGVLVGAALVLVAAPVGAHSFLVDTRPAQGERLTRSPSEVVFQFTEAVVADSVDVATTGDGEPLQTGRPEVEADGRVLRVPLTGPVEGVAVVSWQVVSAVDGHEAAGELAFAVGDVGQLPATATTVPYRDGIGETMWRWVFLAGLSLGAGALVAASTGQIQPARRVTWARLGLTVAAVGPAVFYLSELPGGLSRGASRAAGAAALSAAAAALTVGRSRRDVIPLALTAGAVVAWAARSHAATAMGVLGAMTDAAHLGGAALWLGTLTVLVADLWRTRTAGGSLVEAARRYARWALPAVMILAAAGAVSAITLLTGPSDLWTTTYGRLLTTKLALFGVALILAGVAKRRALGSGNVALLRRVTTGEVTVVASIVAASGILAGLGPPALARGDVETLLGPPPIEGLVARAADLAGNMTVGVAAGDGRVDILVYNQSTGGIEDVDVEARATFPDGSSVDLHPRPCGTGCFTQRLALPAGATSLTVLATSSEWTGGTADLALRWPPRARQPGLLDEVVASMRAVERLTLTETVSSGPQAQATHTFTLTGADFIDREVYAAGAIDDVAPLPGGRPGVRIYLAGSRMLIDLDLDDRHRIVQERIVSPGHDITRTFAYP